jgi:hypothetical protein
VYDPSKSKTAKKASGKWNISYGDGSSASGDVYTDTVTVAGVAIPGQAVELAKHLSSSFLSDGGNDGLLGLAWPAINTVSPRPVPTPVANMISKKLLAQPLFTVKLARGGAPGFYSFGYIDPSAASGSLAYTPVDNSQGFWQVPSASWSLNGSVSQLDGNTAILDTGTTLALVSDDVVSAIYAAIPGATMDQEQGGWKYPSDAAVPAVQFAVGDTLYTVNAQDFAFGPADDGFTFGGIQSRGDMTFDILGDVFLKSVYVVYVFLCLLHMRCSTDSLRLASTRARPPSVSHSAMTESHDLHDRTMNRDNELWNHISLYDQHAIPVLPTHALPLSVIINDLTNTFYETPGLRWSARGLELNCIYPHTWTPVSPPIPQKQQYTPENRQLVHIPARTEHTSRSSRNSRYASAIVTQKLGCTPSACAAAVSSSSTPVVDATLNARVWSWNASSGGASVRGSRVSSKESVLTGCAVRSVANARASRLGAACAAAATAGCGARRNSVICEACGGGGEGATSVVVEDAASVVDEAAASTVVESL